MFWSAAGFCRRCTRRGACPAGRRLTLPPLYPAGGLPALSPPCPAFSLLPCPPSPKGKDRPPARARRAIFPAGKGETQSLFRRGLPPRHPCTEPPAALTVPSSAVPGRGACLLCRLPTLQLVCFPAPYPPDPLPRRGRGRPRLFHARGFAPCIPGLNPNGAGSRGEPLTRRGRARLVGG